MLRDAQNISPSELDRMIDWNIEFEEYYNIMISLNKQSNFSKESLQMMFDKGRIQKIEEKRIQLEIVIGNIFKLELLPI